MKRIFRSICDIQNIKAGTLWELEDDMSIHPIGQPHRIMFYDTQPEFFEEIPTTLF